MNRPQKRALHPLRSLRALEMTMRETLDGLQDMACQSGLQPFADCLQILSIEAVPEADTGPLRADAAIMPFFSPPPAPRSDNVLDYLLQREASL